MRFPTAQPLSLGHRAFSQKLAERGSDGKETGWKETRLPPSIPDGLDAVGALNSGDLLSSSKETRHHRAPAG